MYYCEHCGKTHEDDYLPLGWWEYTDDSGITRAYCPDCKGKVYLCYACGAYHEGGAPPEGWYMEDGDRHITPWLCPRCADFFEEE